MPEVRNICVREKNVVVFDGFFKIIIITIFTCVLFSVLKLLLALLLMCPLSATEFISKAVKYENA